MQTALIGIVGVLLGVIVNELLRRTRRIESYTGRVFDRRLEKYEEFMAIIQMACDIATDVMEDTENTPEQRHELICDAIGPIADFADGNELYIDSDLSAHCVAMFMGAEDVLDSTDAAEQEAQRQRIRDSYVAAKRMIREDSGIAEIDKLFKTITRPRLTSPVIDRIRYLRKHPEAMDVSRD